MKRNVLLLLLLLLIITVLNIAVFAQDTKGKFDLTLTLTGVKSEILPLEPVGFKISVINNSQGPIKVDSSLSFNAAAVRLEIKNPDGKTVAPTQLSHVAGRMFFLPKDLATGESMESLEIFDFKTQTYFGTPGQYQVRASYKNGAGKKIYSEWIDLTLTEPTGTDKVAYDFLYKKMQKTYYPFTSWSTEELEEFVLNYSGTGYANHARYSLGERYFEREKEKAEEHFRAITDPTFVYSEQVREWLQKLESEKKQN